MTRIPLTPLPTERAKSSSVDCGKPFSSLLNVESVPLKSPPASAPLVQSARLFWNSIENNGVVQSLPVAQHQQQQNHPIGSTQLYQQQFQRSRQKFALGNQFSVESSGNSTSSGGSSTTSQSPFAFVAGI